MATQSFMSDMQALSRGRVQQNSPAPQQQNQSTGTVSQPSQQAQQNQIAHSQSQPSANPSVQSSVSVAQGQPQQKPPPQTVQGSSAASTVTVTQVPVVAPSPPHSQQQQQQQTDAVVQASSATGASQFIAVAVSEQDSQGQGTVTLQPAQSVHPTYVQYVDGNGDPNLYAANNGQMTGYSVYSVTDSTTMYTPATATYYNTGSGTAVTYSQVGTNVSQGSAGVGIQSQILAHQGGGAYLVQGNALDGESHTINHGGRASPSTLMEEGGGYKVQGTMMDNEAHHTLTTASATVTLATRISPVTEDPRKVADIISPFSNDQCVIQTLHSPHDSSQLQLGPQPQPQQQPQQPPSHHSQQQNVRDMDIIHVQWLIDNYETAEGVSLPRSTLYNHYLRHCNEHKLEPVNAASFGKLIRSVFLGLRTRRLGTRGNSKYHYYGIRVKPNSPLNQIADDIGTTALRQQPLNQMKRFKPSTLSKPENHDGSSTSSTSGLASQTTDNSHSQQQHSQQQQHQQYLGDASAAIPSFMDIDNGSFSLPEGITDDHLQTFRNLYREHCEAFLDAVVNLQFSMVEALWQTFWRTYSNSHGPNEHEKVLGKSKLYLLCRHEPVLQFVRKADYQFYQNLVDVLIPDVLRPIPSSLTQAIRNFAKSLEGWLTSAMAGCPEEMIKIKVSAVSAFAQTLRRYTSLNHLAQAARAVLQNSSQINQMMADLNRVDFHNVQEQASWVCQCDENTVQQLEQDFKLTLQQQNSLEQWAAWLEGVVSLVLQPYEGKNDFPKAARQFLLKWSFYSSMVIRDLTLRSAASFGSFHLIRLLYDEYMFYLIEHRVAKAIGETPIAVMGEDDNAPICWSQQGKMWFQEHDMIFEHLDCPLQPSDINPTKFIGFGTKLASLGNETTPSQKTVLINTSSPAGTKGIIENGSTGECNIVSLPQDSYGSSATLTNGLKESSTPQTSLIGQPQVRFAESVTEGGTGDSVSQQSKKLKAV